MQKEIKNVDYDRSSTEEESDDLDHDHAEDTIKRGMGNSTYVELLFAALAKASGFEVNLAFSGNRNVAFFTPEKYPFSSFIRLGGVAVKTGTGWKYFNASVPYLPYGSLSWYEEGVVAMLVGPDGFLWHHVPVSSPESSPAKRTGTLAISEDGTLEGRVKLEYSGQQAVGRRADLYRLSDDKRKKEIERDLKARISTAEISEIVIENVADTSKPLVYSYTLKIPNYAQRTGQRLFLQPGVFQYGVKPLFSASTRKHSIHFAYPWSETDDLDIKLPAGFDPDTPDQPAPIADQKKIASLRIALGINKSTNVLRYKREFHFGGGGAILFPQAAYPPLKAMFDAFQKADSHVITLKERK